VFIESTSHRPNQGGGGTCNPPPSPSPQTLTVLPGLLVIAALDPKYTLAMNHQMRVYDDVFEMLPNEENPSPMVRINQMNPSPDFQLFAKLEWMNPFGSVKDRAAWAMLRELEEKRLLGGGRGIVEPTSGNTGISLAAMARARGLHMRAVVPNKIPLEKKVLLKICGA